MAAWVPRLIEQPVIPGQRREREGKQPAYSRPLSVRVNQPLPREPSDTL